MKPEGERAPVHRRPLEREEYATPENVAILEIWNLPQDAAVSVARARLAPGEDSETHWLVGVDERLLVLSGQGVFEAAGSWRREVLPGDLVFVPAGTPQRCRNTGTEDLVLLCVCTPRFTPACYRAGSPADPS